MIENKGIDSDLKKIYSIIQKKWSKSFGSIDGDCTELFSEANERYAILCRKYSGQDLINLVVQKVNWYAIDRIRKFVLKNKASEFYFEEIINDGTTELVINSDIDVKSRQDAHKARIRYYNNIGHKYFELYDVLRILSKEEQAFIKSMYFEGNTIKQAGEDIGFKSRDKASKYHKRLLSKLRSEML